MHELIIIHQLSIIQVGEKFGYCHVEGLVVSCVFNLGLAWESGLASEPDTPDFWLGGLGGQKFSVRMVLILFFHAGIILPN